MARQAMIGLVLLTATLTARGLADENLADGFADGLHSVAHGAKTGRR